VRRERGRLSLHKHIDEGERSGLPRRSRRRRSIYRNGRIYTANMGSRDIYNHPFICALRLASRNQLLRTRTIRGAACVVRLNLVLHLSHVRLRNDRPDLVCAESCVRFIWFFVSLLRRATSISEYPSSTRRAERANSLRSYTRIHSPFTTASVVAPRNLVSHYFQKQHIILPLSHSNLWKWK